MTSLPDSFLWAVGLTAVSGLPGLFFPKTARSGQVLATVLASLGAILGLLSIALFFYDGGYDPGAGAMDGGSLFFWDPLSCFFLAGVFLLSGLGSLYGMGYWKQEDHPDNGRKLRFFYGTLSAGMASVIVSRHAFVFLLSWEVMALSAFFLVCTEDDKKEAREAGWVYFVATHLSTLLLFAFFAYYGSLRGTFSLFPFGATELASGQANGLFLLALAAFGLKAGVFPLHVWLPSAHANAPSHVSAVLSGVLLKVGVYGLMRACWLFPSPPPWWGETVVGLGVVSSVLGVVFALGQHDLKRLLAYHSIENIGIIFLGFGLALWGRAEARSEWVWWGLAGALLHVWNHGLFKSSLFYAAGSVIHSTGTRRIDELGGLSKTMPWTALGFLIGAVAICGLPPFNGFISEFLVYLGFFRTVGDDAGWSPGLFAVPALALTGALALACFTKVFGAVFLGEPRTERAGTCAESGPAILFPIGVLSVCCLWIGLFPRSVLPVLGSVIRQWDPGMSVPGGTVLEGVPWGVFTGTGLLLLVALGLGQWWLRKGRRGFGVPARVSTWDCGFIQPSPSIQTSASSYAQTLVDMFQWVLWPIRRRKGGDGFFPKGESYATHVPETVLDRGVLPLLRGIRWILKWFKVLQPGYVQVYVLYILLALVALILWR